jgi:hypothetical protein
VRPSETQHATLVLAQPGAHAFFRPALPVLQERGWRLAVNPEDLSLETAVLVTSTSNAESERGAVHWARENGVPCAQLVDSWYDYRQRIELTNGQALLPDEIWLFDDTARRDAAAEGLPQERLRIVGNPAWEFASTLPEAPASHVLLIDQPVAADMGRQVGYDEADFMQLVADALDQHGCRDLRLYVAPHPRRRSPVPNLPKGAEVVHDAREGLAGCGTVIGMFSSLLIDAFLGGRHVVSVQPGAGAVDYSILSRLGLVPRVTKPSDLASAMTGSRQNPQEFAWRFQHSSERLARAFAELAAADI